MTKYATEWNDRVDLWPGHGGIYTQPYRYMCVYSGKKKKRNKTRGTVSYISGDQL